MNFFKCSCCQICLKRKLLPSDEKQYLNATNGEDNSKKFSTISMFQDEKKIINSCEILLKFGK